MGGARAQNHTQGAASRALLSCDFVAFSQEVHHHEVPLPTIFILPATCPLASGTLSWSLFGEWAMKPVGRVHLGHDLVASRSCKTATLNKESLVLHPACFFVYKIPSPYLYLEPYLPKHQEVLHCPCVLGGIHTPSVGRGLSFLFPMMRVYLHLV